MKTTEISKALSDELHQYSARLSAISKRIQLIERLLENVEYSRISEDEFAVHHQIKTGLLTDIGDGLNDLKEEVQSVSNAICPD